AGEDTNRCCRSRRVAQESVGCVKPGEVVDVTLVKIIPRCSSEDRWAISPPDTKGIEQRCRGFTKVGHERRRRIVPLARRQDVVPPPTPTAEEAPHEAVLLPEERQLLGDDEGPLIREVKTGERVFARPPNLVGGILGKENAIAAAQRAEYLGDVVQILAPGVGAAYRQLFEMIVSGELRLQTVVVGETAVGTDTSYTTVAILTPLRHRRKCGRSRARGEARWNQAGEIVFEPPNRNSVGYVGPNQRIRIQSLEQICCMVPNIPNFNSRVLGDLTFQSKVPSMYLVRAKVRSKAGLGEGPRIEQAFREERGQLGAHGRAKRSSRQWLAAGSAAGKGLQEYFRG